MGTVQDTLRVPAWLEAAAKRIPLNVSPIMPNQRTHRERKPSTFRLRMCVSPQDLTGEPHRGANARERQSFDDRVRSPVARSGRTTRYRSEDASTRETKCRETLSVHLYHRQPSTFRPLVTT